MLGDAERGNRAGSDAACLKDEQGYRVVYQRVEGHEPKQHGLEVEGQERVRPGKVRDVQLGVPGGARIDAHTEPLAVEEIPQHLVGETEVLGVGAASQMAKH